MTTYGDVVAISATTSGVSGTITVPMGVRLLGLNIASAAAGGAALGVVASVEIKWSGLQTPMKFVPSMSQLGSTNGSSLFMCKTPLIDLRKLPSVTNTNTITITVTTTASIAVEVGLIWVAA